MSFTTLLPVWEYTDYAFPGFIVLAVLEHIIFKEKFWKRIGIYFGVFLIIYQQASLDLGWLIFLGICFYTIYKHIKKYRNPQETKRILRLLFAACYLIYPIFVVIGFNQAAKDNNGVIFFPKYAAAQIRAKISHVNYDMRHINEALDKYKADRNEYPVSNAGYTLPKALTTPIAYIQAKQFPVDILAPYHPPLGYTTNSSRNMAIIASRGPDWSWQIHWQQPDWAAMTTEGNLLVYNPTNGTVSSGDIYHISPPGLYTYHSY
ncbi:MAG: hypothetical protein ACE14V_15650 [bacterium]